jgi:signal recognition particle receptor subunit alpha
MVRDVLIEGRVKTEDEGYDKDGYSVRWTMENGLGLVFIVSYAPPPSVS